MARISIVVILVSLVADMACGQPVVVAPEETDEILANPGMGWQTLHRTKTEDKNLPSWIPSTVHYARWGWRELEPRPGEIDDAFLDGILKETREAGQTLAFRVMCNSTYPRQPYHPKWLPGSIDLFTEEFFKQPADLPPGDVHDVVDTISLPDDLSPGSYNLSVAVVGEADIEPVVQLGIEGRSEDGWYPLSRLTISR